MRKNVLLVLSLLAVLSWSPPTEYTDGSPIPWEYAADILYIPAVSASPYGPWTDYPETELLWATMPDPAPGKTLYYSCRAVLNGESSGYAPAVSKTVPKNRGGKKK